MLALCDLLYLTIVLAVSVKSLAVYPRWKSMSFIQKLLVCSKRERTYVSAFVQSENVCKDEYLRTHVLSNFNPSLDIKCTCAFVTPVI